MFSRGHLTLGRFRGAPVRVHWSAPIAMLVFTRFRFAPGAWLGFVLLVLAHELGHAAMVAASGLEVLAADVHGLGGVCRWQGYPTPFQRALIAWGGVLAQAALGLGTLLVLAVLGSPEGVFAADLADVFLGTNLWVALVNLIPIPPLDGAEAWTIVPILAARRRRRRAVAAERARVERMMKQQLATLDDPEDLAPLPDEVRRVLDRVMAEGRALHESAKKGK
jgi:Zn-dependent protease